LIGFVFISKSFKGYNCMETKSVVPSHGMSV